MPPYWESGRDARAPRWGAYPDRGQSPPELGLQVKPAVAKTFVRRIG